MAESGAPQAPGDTPAPEELGPRPRTFSKALAEALGFPERAIAELIATLTEAAVPALTRGGELVALGFGRWVHRPWRASSPSALPSTYAWDPSEVPHPGRLDFEPAASLLRQIDDRQLNTRATFTCAPFLTALMQRTGVPQAQASQVMRLIFVALTDLLVHEGVATLPGFGTFLVARRPTALLVDVATSAVQPLIRKTVKFTPSPELHRALPDAHRVLSWGTPPETVDYALILAEDPEGRRALLRDEPPSVGDLGPDPEDDEAPAGLVIATAVAGAARHRVDPRDLDQPAPTGPDAPDDVEAEGAALPEPAALERSLAAPEAAPAHAPEPPAPDAGEGPEAPSPSVGPGPEGGDAGGDSGGDAGGGDAGGGDGGGGDGGGDW